MNSFARKYIIDFSLYTSEMLVFLDETGADRCHLIRKYGYSLHGVPLKHKILLARGERVSGLAFMSTNGLLDVGITKGTSLYRHAFFHNFYLLTDRILIVELLWTTVL